MEADGKGLKVAYQVGARRNASHGCCFSFLIIRLCLCCVSDNFMGVWLWCLIQGCAGAYSEAAAKKAYPNCETVPCEHFDTAFQVAGCRLLSTP